MRRNTSTASTERRSIGEPSREHVLYDILALVAEVKGGDLMDLRPLSEVVDPEAVETLLTASNADVDISFPYEGGYVRVDAVSVEFEHDFDLP